MITIDGNTIRRSRGPNDENICRDLTRYLRRHRLLGIDRYIMKRRKYEILHYRQS